MLRKGYGSNQLISEALFTKVYNGQKELKTQLNKHDIFNEKVTVEDSTDPADFYGGGTGKKSKRSLDAVIKRDHSYGVSEARKDAKDAWSCHHPNDARIQEVPVDAEHDAHGWTTGCCTVGVPRKAFGDQQGDLGEVAGGETAPPQRNDHTSSI